MFKARPLASTSTTLSWTDAWSLDVIRRSKSWMVNALAQDYVCSKHTGGRALAGNVEIDENTLTPIK